MNKKDINKLKNHARRCLRIMLQSLSFSFKSDLFVEYNTSEKQLKRIAESTREYIPEYQGYIDYGIVNRTLAELRLKKVKNLYFSQELFDRLSTIYAERDEKEWYAFSEHEYVQGQLYMIGSLLKGHDKDAEIILAWSKLRQNSLFRYQFRKIPFLSLES